ncbi:MAG: anthranilate synthase component I [Candidatus Nanopelagicales bacterium]|nr:anthranilate synthase component I [Candidatus Nanopelagicales bacterium]MDZ4250803.1 anthranilate synthase component I [Candidatus Nanopelagicales bacterium]
MTNIASADGNAVPSLSEFRELAKTRRVVPVMRRVLADGFTPVGLYQALAGGRAGTFLLESAEHGRVWSRYSFVGVRCPAMLTESDGRALWSGKAPEGVAHTDDPLEAMRATIEALATDRPEGLPPFTSGLVGYVGYDAVRRLERLPDENPEELGVPELCMLLATDVAVLDHADGTVLLITNAVNYDNSDERADAAWVDAMGRLDRMTRDLARAVPIPPARYRAVSAKAPASRTDRDDYLDAVAKSREYIEAGDAFQIVISQRFSTKCPASAIDVYRVLRATNPSPYMYLFRFPEATGSDDGLSDRVAFDVVGSSPEALVTVKAGECMLHPLAGTRRRGDSPEEDVALSEDLLADDKERAEHLMLVDLGRNDLGRVCAPGSVEVVEFMQVERYSHVMHIVSTVVGRLAPGKSAFDALAAAFPAGTLSGAPKPRAMEIIDELEPVRRGLYGGAVGYLDFAGDLDTAIAIRTAVILGGVAYVQAGAGLVADSVPETEDAECRNKAAAVLNAVASAATMDAALTDDGA